MTRYCYYDTIQALAKTLRDTHGDLDVYGCLTEDIDTRLYGIFQDCRRILEDRLLRGEDAEVVSPRSDHYSIKCLGSRVDD